MNVLMREFEPETVEDLQEVLAQFPGGMAINDCLGERLCVRLYRDDETGDLFLEVE